MNNFAGNSQQDCGAACLADQVFVMNPLLEDDNEEAWTEVNIFVG